LQIKSKGKHKNTKTFVKYINSVKSEKTGHWRFNEQMIALNEGEKLNDALKRIETESSAMDMEIPEIEVSSEEQTTLPEPEGKVDSEEMDNNADSDASEKETSKEPSSQE